MSAAFSNKVLIATLWQRTSDKGNDYLSDFLGTRRVIGFRGESTTDGTPTWDLYPQPGREQQGGTGQGQQQRAASNITGTAPRPGRVQRHQPPPGQRSDSARPFNSDDSSDIGRRG